MKSKKQLGQSKNLTGPNIFKIKVRMKPLLTEISINKKNIPALLGVISAKKLKNKNHLRAFL